MEKKPILSTSIAHIGHVASFASKAQLAANRSPFDPEPIVITNQIVPDRIIKSKRPTNNFIISEASRKSGHIPRQGALPYKSYKFRSKN